MTIENIILLWLTLLGCLMLFLYGIKEMSMGLMQLAGSNLRAWLRNLSQHRLPGFCLGAWITMVIQSSSAMTVMAVSMVNAGLLSLRQSISLIMGANVGTTITALFIALVGFQWHLGFIAIPLIVLSIPFTYAGKVSYKPLCETIIGLSLMMFGFCLFIDQMPVMDASRFPDLTGWVQMLSRFGFGSVCLSLVLGIVVTMLLQSSAATILIAMVLCSSGWLTLPMAAAMVVGDNVGTTLSALTASRQTNVSARRAAWSHLVFNLFGMLLSLLIAYPLWYFAGGNVYMLGVSGAVAVALFHFCLNMVSAMLLIWFVPQFSDLLCKFIPDNENDEDEFHLNFIRGGLLDTAEFSVEEARKETVLFGERCQRMLDLTDKFVHMPNKGEGISHAFSRIEKYEKITDRLELEIVRYLNDMDKSNVSERAAARIRSLFKAVDELESIGDCCYNIARAVVRRNEAGVSFIRMQQNNIDRMFQETRIFMDMMVQMMHKNSLSMADLNRAYNQEDVVNSLRNQYREQNIGNVQHGYYTYQSGVLYMDVLSGCEKLCDFIVNVLEALAEQDNVPARDEDEVSYFEK